MVDSRDYLQKRIIANGYPDENTLMIVYKSVEHEECPPKKDFIRAETILSGFIIRDLGNGASQLTIISQTDIKGKIPKAVVNMITAKMAPKQVSKFLAFAKTRKGIPVTLNLEQYRCAPKTK